MPEEFIEVQGLTELLNGFRKADAGLAREIRKELISVGEIVKVDSHEKAVAAPPEGIRNIGTKWSQFKLGMTAGAVYVAPGVHNSGGSPRPNLAPLLGKAMVEAVEQDKEIVAERMYAALENLHQNAGLIKNLSKLT